MVFGDNLGVQISREHEEADFVWHVYRNCSGYPDTVDICLEEGSNLAELTEEMLVKMLQEIRNPKMH